MALNWLIPVLVSDCRRSRLTVAGRDSKADRERALHVLVSEFLVTRIPGLGYYVTYQR